jgi:L-2-amino-thiazoline-4-carboxylic acid hydrolase
MNNDRRDLVAQIKNRALIYMEIYDVLSAEVGASRAETLLAEAIFQRGLAAGKSLATYGPDDLEGLKKGFLESVPGGADLFKPRVLRCDRDNLEVQLQGCPLKDAWREAGLPEDKIATLCRIAGAVDQGLFRGAGFKVENRTWTPGAEGCCHLNIQRGG